VGSITKPIIPNEFVVPASRKPTPPVGRYDQVPSGHVADPERATLRGVIGVPLEWRGRVIGACIVFSKDSRRVFGPGDAELLELFARHEAIVLATAQLREAALVIDDDVAVKDSTYTVGRRGVAGNFFVIKAVGAAADGGADLDELLRVGTKVNAVTRTMGMALTSCTPPAKGSPLFDLGDDEMEMGVGIHGEPGRRREKLASANEIVDELLDAVVSDLPYGHGDDVALMINGLGGTPVSELYLLYGYAHEQLTKRGINVRRNYVGNYCTSLDMAGCSITLTRLDDEITGLLAAPAEIAIRTF
jgi:dihydroxyacetone kinase